MTTPGQMPLLMRQEDLATWDNWLSRQETSTLESLLNGGNTPGHAAYIWGSAGMGKSHILQACCDFQGERARYFPLRDFVLYPPEQVLAGAESARVIALDDVDAMDGHPHWQEALFGLFNLCQESGSRLLVTASKAPQQLAGVLPDLRSRLSSLPVFRYRDSMRNRSHSCSPYVAIWRGSDWLKTLCATARSDSAQSAASGQLR